MSESTSRPPTELPPAARRNVAGVVGTIGLLTVANLVRPEIAAPLWYGAVLVGLIVIVNTTALTHDELGVGRSTAGAGLRLGGLVFVAITAVIVIGGFIGVVEDDRTSVDTAEALWRALLVIPIATVAVEEVAFRGVLHGLLARVITPAKALAVGAVVFGLWHVYPAASGDGVTAADVSIPLVALGTFVATTVAGVGFVWLRQRSGSLLAPVLAHIATNSVAFLVAWAFG